MNKTELGTKILETLKWRYATKVFDSNKKISEDDLNIILETARLSPSSYGCEMWKFIVVKNQTLREKIKEAAYGQPQITDASDLIIVTYRTDAAVSLTNETINRTSKIRNIELDKLEGFKSMLENSVNQKIADGTLESWIKSQTYIPLGIMIESAALLEIDSCPIEGFDSIQVDEILGLKEKNLKSSTILAVGYRGDDKMSLMPKVRRESNEVVEFI